MARGRRPSPVVAKHPMDKSMVLEAMSKIIDAGPLAVDVVLEIMQDTQASRRDRLRASELFIERIIPTLARIQGVDLRPAGKDEIDWAAIYMQALDRVETKHEPNGNGSGDARIH